MGAPVTGLRLMLAASVINGANDECSCWPPGLAKLPVRIHNS
jgi:hypothetical protein